MSFAVLYYLPFYSWYDINQYWVIMHVSVQYELQGQLDAPNYIKYYSYVVPLDWYYVRYAFLVKCCDLLYLISKTIPKFQLCLVIVSLYSMICKSKNNSKTVINTVQILRLTLMFYTRWLYVELGIPVVFINTHFNVL